MIVPRWRVVAIAIAAAGAQGGSPDWSKITVTFQLPSRLRLEFGHCAVVVIGASAINPIKRYAEIRLLLVIETSFPDRSRSFE
jgi:hypothetical protein